MRALASLLVVLALLAGGAVLADSLLTRTAEQQAAQRLSAELGGAPAEVDLRGWPVSLRLLGGQVPRADLAATGVTFADSPVRIERFEATLEDVRVRFADLRGDGPLPVNVGAGRFTVDLDEENVNRAVVVPGGITLGEGLAAVDVAGRRVEVVPIVEAGQVVLRPVVEGTDLPPVTVPLPDLPAEVVIEQVIVRPGVLTVSGQVLRLTR